MKKKLFMYFIIGLFIFFILAYAFIAIENYFVKSLDVINEEIGEKEIVFFEEIHEDNEIHGMYLLNNGNIYSYTYSSYGDKTVEEKISNMKDSTLSKVDKITKKDKGYLNMYIGKLKYSCFKRTTKADRPTKKIYYIDYNDNKLKTVISSGEEVMKNKSFSAARIISILKKYSIRVD